MTTLYSYMYNNNGSNKPTVPKLHSSSHSPKHVPPKLVLSKQPVASSDPCKTWNL